VYLLIVNCFAGTITYQEDNSIFPNPERGWRGQAMPQCCDNYPDIKGPHAPLTVEQLLEWRNSENAITVFKDDIKIQQWESDIPQSRLDEIQSDFDAIREAGLKSIPRIVYNWGMGNEDPGEQYIMRHLDQLEPIIKTNIDVIMAWEFGTFGGCGEAVSSPQYIDGNNNGRQSLKDNALRIYNRIAQIVPEDRMLAAKLPAYKYDLLGWSVGGSTYPPEAVPLTAEEAYDGSLRARIGWYNDNFAGDANHWGFFYAWPEQDKDFVENDALYVLMEGELSGSTDYNRTNGERELKRFRFTTYQPTGDGDAEVIAAWKSSGQWDRMARNLGYRFRLIEMTVSSVLKPGATFELRMEMANDGYARIVNARKVEVLLRNKANGNIYMVDIDHGRGNRLWLPGPGETKTLEGSAGIHPDMPEGDYEVLLNLPDPYPTLHDRPEYSIRLANLEVWEEGTGYNSLLHAIEVSTDGGGEAYAGNDYFMGNDLDPVSVLNPDIKIYTSTSTNTYITVINFHGKLVWHGRMSDEKKSWMKTFKKTNPYGGIYIYTFEKSGRKITQGRLTIIR
jgi:hypothetical protein